MSEDDWQRWRRIDPSDPASPYYTASRPDTDPAPHAPIRLDWPSDAPALPKLSHDDRLLPFQWDAAQSTETDLPPWAIVASTYLACLGLLYFIGDRSLAIALGAIAAIVGLGIFLVRGGPSAGR